MSEKQHHEPLMDGYHCAPAISTERWMTGLLTAIGIFLTAILGLVLYLLKTNSDAVVTVQSLKSDVAHLQSLLTEMRQIQNTFVTRVEWEKSLAANDAEHKALLESIRLLTETIKKR